MTRLKKILPTDRRAEPFTEGSDLPDAIQQAQEILYNFFFEIVKKWQPESVLEEFNGLFIVSLTSVNPDAIKALYEILFLNQEEVFRNTFKRTCYILVNNWWAVRQTESIEKFIDLFSQIPKNEGSSILSLPVARLNTWVNNFFNSQDYQDLKLFSAADEQSDRENDWGQRYTSYLLTPQYTDLKNPAEQREAARELSEQLKERFKFDLAMYTARSQPAVPEETTSKNPTLLGDEAVRLVKKIVAKPGLFSYKNLANIFVQQNQEVKYKNFKRNLHKYLFYNIELANPVFEAKLKAELAKQLEKLYADDSEESLNAERLLKTSRKLIDYFTTETQQLPSLLFALLMSQGESLTLAILLIKILLICPNARVHLEARIAHLIQYYQKYPKEQCSGIINFLEIFNLAFVIYTENVRYNLVKVKEEVDTNYISDLDTYRIFSQLKAERNLEGANLRGTDLHGAELSGVNLQRADLSSVNLSNSDLSNSQLTQANLNQANLSSADLITAELKDANLSGTNLQRADLRRANLCGANLSRANLTVAKLRSSDLREADLKGAQLGGADLKWASLNGADLSLAQLRHANLSDANLSGANLSGANLSSANLNSANLIGANLSDAQLRYSHLIDADLSRSNLSNADLRRAELSGANFSGAILQNARFAANSGLSRQQAIALKRAGAIFEETFLATRPPISGFSAPPSTAKQEELPQEKPVFPPDKPRRATPGLGD